MTTTTYAADSTALLIVDPYNDFMSEGGKLYEATKETPKRSGSTTTCASWFRRSERRISRSSSCLITAGEKVTTTGGST
jgi:nicotinamidase-related amidase